MRRVLVWGMELGVYYVLWLMLVKPMVVYYADMAKMMKDFLAFYGY